MLNNHFVAIFAAAAAAVVAGSPVEDKRNACAALNEIITIMHEQSVATPFCSSLLSIPTVTQTSTVTSSPPCTTTTVSTQSVATITAFATTTVYAVTTVYPVCPVSVTSTCALGATVVPSTTPALKARRDNYGGSEKPCTTVTQKTQTSTAIGTPTCLTGFIGSAITTACSCLSIPTPTTVSITTTTLPKETLTKVIANTASITVTSTITSTLWTSTYSATQFYTSTFTILPSPTSTITLPDGEVFGVYNDLDFAGQDIVNFFCYVDGPPQPSPYLACNDFADCIAECAFYNDNDLGSATGTTCGAVVYNAPADGSSGSCYLKTGQTGCGSTNDMTNTGVLLPLIPNDVQ